MRIGIMQPYFVPYIGYWQLMNAVDKYVIYDDVNYIRGGWINRNRILIDNQPKYFNVPLIGASQNKLINEIQVNVDNALVRKNLRTIESAYKKAPYFDTVYPLLKTILDCRKDKISEYIEESFKVLCNYLDITTELIMSSSINKNCNLKSQKKILEICKILKCTEYYNAIGGRDLYSYNDFRNNGIKLVFLKSNKIKYKQFSNNFYSDLSIIDVIMFNSKDEVKDMLLRYDLIFD
ncbi:MAG: WbqC family protein [Lachnospiraceae bacterium]|nr:WbqC family protein [Lachnospiraceae bacterium]